LTTSERLERKSLGAQDNRSMSALTASVSEKV